MSRFSWLLVKAVCAVGALAVPAAGRAGTIHVPADFPTIQEAIDAAAGGDEVVVADGVYAGKGNRDLDFAGKAITVRSQSGDPARCFIECGEAGRAFIFHGGETPASRVEGFTISNGMAGSGGAVYIDHASPTVSKCAFIGNRASLAEPGNTNGGAVYVDGGAPTLAGCTFTENAATAQKGLAKGGAIYNRGAATAIESCTFNGNSAASGGAIYNTGGDPVLSGCSFSGNNAVSEGGAIYSVGSSPGPTLRDVALTGNTAPHGAGMYVAFGSAVLEGCAFRGNLTGPYGRGGGLYFEQAAAVLEGCSFIDNLALGGDGGGIYCDGSGPELTACAFDANRAGSGGGMYNHQSSPVLRDCLIARNQDGWGGAAMYSAAGSSPTLIGCTIDRNWTEYVGAFVSEDSSPTLINCTLTGTRANHSTGGMLNNNSSPRLTNCRIIENEGFDIVNSAGSPALANCLVDSIRNWDSASAPTLVNCVLRYPLSGAPSASATYSDVPGGSPGAGNIDADPGFDAGGPSGTWTSAARYDAQTRMTYLTDHGASFLPGALAGRFIEYGTVTRHGLIASNTETTIAVRGMPGTTVTAGSAYRVHDFRLAAGSPCIDAGNNTAVPPDSLDLDSDGDTAELLPLDVFGNPRFAADADRADSGCGVPVVVDMGPAELQHDPAGEVLPADLDGDGGVGIADVLVLLASWGQCTSACCLSDLDFDGKTAESDLLALLEAWDP